MAIDYDALAAAGGIGKGELRAERKRRKRLDDDTLEAEARKAVRARDGSRCAVPGCREHGAHLHHIVYRSKSRALRWAIGNLCFLCVAHHQLEHAGKITLSGNADEELIVTGDKRYLEFKL